MEHLEVGHSALSIGRVQDLEVQLLEELQLLVASRSALGIPHDPIQVSVLAVEPERLERSHSVPEIGHVPTLALESVPAAETELLEAVLAGLVEKV